MTIEKEFAGKVALVTGAAMGIGAAVATLLAERGAKVVLVDRAEKELTKMAKGLERKKLKAHAITADVSKAEEVEHAIKEVVKVFGRLDVVSNNAGIQRYGTVETTPEAEWDEVMNVNLKSVYLVCHYAIPHLRKRKGAVVNMASVQSFATQQNVAAYTTSKHALIGLTRSMALDFAKDGVRVNAVAPGTVDTPMLHWAVSLDPNPTALMKVVNNMHPLRRIAKPKEIAEVGAFLASDRASFITGATVVADGGLLLPLGGAPKDES